MIALACLLGVAAIVALQFDLAKKREELAESVEELNRPPGYWGDNGEDLLVDESDWADWQWPERDA